MAREEFSTRVADFNQAQIDSIESAVAEIQETDLVAVNTKIDNLVTGFTPQGKTATVTHLETGSAGFVTVKSVVSGSGFFNLALYVTPKSGTIIASVFDLKITVDTVVVFNGTIVEEARCSGRYYTAGAILNSIFRYENSFSVEISTVTGEKVGANITDYAD